MAGQLASERVVIASPMSFTGSAKRLWRMTTGRAWAIPVALLLVMVVWMMILSWYLMLGLLVVPWRVLRRGQRREKAARLRHQEVLAAQRRSQ